MNILAIVTQAESLIQQGTTIYNSLTSQLKDATAAVNETDLESAKARLEQSLARAQEAHDNLKAAIDERLAGA